MTWCWELAVAAGLCGLGFGTLRLLKLSKAPSALSGSIGLAVLLLAGGWINLARLIRPAVLFAFVALGVLCMATEIVLRRNWFAALFKARQVNRAAMLTMCLGVCVLLVLLIGGMRRTVWNNDDVSGYIPLSIKAMQGHQLQSDPFSDRRVSSNVGGGVFLNAFMDATGDFRAMAFADAVFGLALYAWSLWAVGRMWGLRGVRLGIILVCVPLVTLLQVNLTPTYLVTASFLAVLLLFNEAAETGITWPIAVLLGGVMGSIAALKSTNLFFILTFVALAALAYKALQPRARVLVPVIGSFAIAAFVLLPWCLQQHRTEGTYFYPILGKGYYANAYGLLPSLHGKQFVVMSLVVAAPLTLFMIAALILAWKLTKGWAVTSRAGLLGYLAAAALAVPVTAIALSGDSVDRYLAPFAMPVFLFVLMMVLVPHAAGTTTDSSAEHASIRRWQLGAVAFLLAGAIYVGGFIGIRMHWYRVEAEAAFEAFGRVPPQLMPYQRLLDEPRISALKQQAQRMQATLPRNATAMASVAYAFPIDFQRNHILLADVPGMAGSSPGMPIDAGAQALMRYLKQQGIQYVIFDRSLIDSDAPAWSKYWASLQPQYGPVGYLEHPAFAHSWQPLGVIQFFVVQHIGAQIEQLARTQPVLYDDGRLFVISLR